MPCGATAAGSERGWPVRASVSSFILPRQGGSEGRGGRFPLAGRVGRGARDRPADSHGTPSQHGFAVLRRILRRRPERPNCRRRSEEHTSELQSLMRISYAVFCLKKKKQHKTKNKS